MSRWKIYKSLYLTFKLRDEMKDTIEKVSNSKKKPTRRKYIIAAVVLLLCIIAGLVYRAITWEQKPDPESERIIRQIVAEQLNKDQIETKIVCFCFV